MPEGPSIVILKESVQEFIGKKVVKTEGTVKNLDLKIFENLPILDFKSWGKHFLICFEHITVRIHFMLFGTYRINESKDSVPRFSLKFDDGELNFYACSVQLLDRSAGEAYDWSADVMNVRWNPEAAYLKLINHPKALICDALLDQNIFAGVGNIIKNEVLFRTRLHPLNTFSDLPESSKRELIDEAVNYSFDFLRWKKESTLKEHWLAHAQHICPRDNAPFRKTYPGKTKRRTFYCELCQEFYGLVLPET